LQAYFCISLSCGIVVLRKIAGINLSKITISRSRFPCNHMGVLLRENAHTAKQTKVFLSWALGGWAEFAQKPFHVLAVCF